MLNRRRALQGSLLVGFAGVLPVAVSRAGTPSPLNPQLDGDISPVHDPCIIREGNTYYVFSTTLGDGAGAQIPWRHSKDLRHWEMGGYVLPGLPAWAVKEIPRRNRFGRPTFPM